jgi:hypothetical protein
MEYQQWGIYARNSDSGKYTRVVHIPFATRNALKESGKLIDEMEEIEFTGMRFVR